jgi:hypothetical protein
MSRQVTLTERMPRCTKEPVPLSDFDVTDGDDERQRRVKWNFRAMFVRYAPCNNGDHCPRASPRLSTRSTDR